jgi:hypothetical protein
LSFPTATGENTLVETSWDYVIESESNSQDGKKKAQPK